MLRTVSKEMELITDELRNFDLCNSNYCRLCCEENNCGINVFSEKFDDKELFVLINMYLPLLVQDDKTNPQTICPGCHIQLQATISFFQLLINGQEKLRKLLNKSIGVEVDETNCIPERAEPTDKTPIFSFDHDLRMKTSGLVKPKFKRGKGRPRKYDYDYPAMEDAPTTASGSPPRVIEDAVILNEDAMDEIEKLNEITSGCQPKRKRKFPVRFGETVNGKELEDIYVEEGLIHPKERTTAGDCEKVTEVIGCIRFEKGQGQCEVVVNTQNSGSKQRSAMQFRCNICQIVFSHEAKFQKHIAEHNTTQQSITEETENNCPVVDSSAEQDDKNRCPICNKKYRHASSLKGHMLSLHGSADNSFHIPSVYPCYDCDKTFSHLSSLSYHKEAMHSNGRLYVCNKCDKTFRHRQLLSRHQAVHSDVRSFQCDQCRCSFKTKSHLVNHKATHASKKRYYCNICGSVFAYKTSLTCHLRSHTGNKPFECAICAKRFAQKGNLKEHLRTHTGEKPFECRVCSKKFTTSSQFTLHFKRHIGYKPWKCEYCGKAFLHKTTWGCHLRRHRGEKPYACIHCGKTFSESWSLKKHERMHTGEKPYSCPTCNKTFSDCSNLKKHKKTHEMNELKQKTIELDLKSDNETKHQMWTLISNGESSNDIDVGGNEQIIYLAYENPNDTNTRLSEAMLISKDPLDLSEKELHKLHQQEGETRNELNGVFVPNMEVMDEHGNPFKFATDGSLFQVTTMDGQPLHVAFGENNHFPVTISAAAEPIIHQLKSITNLPIVSSMTDSINLASRAGDTIEFVPDDQHFKLISDLNTAALNLQSGYLEIV